MNNVIGGWFVSSSEPGILCVASFSDKFSPGDGTMAATSKNNGWAMLQNSRWHHSCCSQYKQSLWRWAMYRLCNSLMCPWGQTHLSLWTPQSLNICSDWLKLGSMTISKLINEVTGLNLHYKFGQSTKSELRWGRN